MWYSIIRYGFLVVLLCILAILYWKKQRTKKVMILTFIMYLLFWSALFYIPFENMFISFDSPEEAYNYQYSGTIDTVIVGERSAMILDSDKERANFFHKSKTGWKLSFPLFAKFVETWSHEEYSIAVYEYKKLDEYFLQMYKDLVPDVSSIDEISDNKGSQFTREVEEEENFNTYLVSYTAYISDIDDYELTINGQVFKFDE